MSAHRETRSRAHEIDENPIKFVRSLQRKLRDRAFSFPKQRAIVKTSAKGKKRGLVASPIEGRVVQRAILEVLQYDESTASAGLSQLREVLECPTSVGGVPKRGVQHGVTLIQSAIQNGAKYYTRSDIKSFFDSVDRIAVLDYLRTKIPCSETADLIERALTVEFENEHEVRDEISLFPIGDIGVAQGNSLSCLAANVALRGFDEIMNGRGITTVRYVDDFVVLGKDIRSIRLALEKGIEHLASIGLTAYTPEESTDKAKSGAVADGFDFIGCHFDTVNVSPGSESRSRLLREVDRTLYGAKRAISKSLREGNARRSQEGFVQHLSAIDRKVRGWGDAYQFTTDRRIFSDLDVQLQHRILGFREWFHTTSRKYEQTNVQRAYGIALLCDTPRLRTTHVRAAK